MSYQQELNSWTKRVLLTITCEVPLKTKYSLDLAQGHNYGEPNEDQTYYLVVVIY